MHDDTETSPQSSPARRILILLFKIAVSGGLLALLFSRTDFSRLGSYLKGASILWLAGALGLYLLMLLVSSWRWHLLLTAQHITVPGGRLVNSYLVATFFNNFLPSNIGGDVIRIRDTASQAGSKTLATTIILMDRGIGLLGLFLVAAAGASLVGTQIRGVPLAPLLWAACAGGFVVAVPVLLAPQSIGRLLSPLRIFHQEWVDERIARFTSALVKFGQQPRSLVACFGGAVVVQVILVGFYVAIVHSMGISVSAVHLAVIVPISFVVQMLPVSMNGFGVREATFSFYFTRLGLPIESALVVSFMGAALIILFSLSGAVAYVGRGSEPT